MLTGCIAFGIDVGGRFLSAKKFLLVDWIDDLSGGYAWYPFLAYVGINAALCASMFCGFESGCWIFRLS